MVYGVCRDDITTQSLPDESSSLSNDDDDDDDEDDDDDDDDVSAVSCARSPDHP